MSAASQLSCRSRRHATTLLVLVLAMPQTSCFLLPNKPVPVFYESGITAGGVWWRDSLSGTGPTVGPDSTLEIDYSAWLPDGTKIDSTYDRGLPEEFPLAEAPVAGWREGLLGMRAGGTRILIVPSALAFGSQGIEGLVPPDMDLRFEIQLLSISD